MAEVMSMIPDESPAGELNADEQESLQLGEEMEAQQDQRLAGKYKNAEELEAAYLELQKKLGDQSSKEEPEETPEETPEEESSDSSLLDQLWEQAQADNYNDETLQQLAKADPTELAKMYLEYRSKAQQSTGPQMTDADATNLRNAVGGDEKYNEMIGWASDNLTAQEIELYDSVMERGDPASAYFAVQALAYRYQDANGVEGNLVQGKSPATSGGFRSQAELVQAMSDPRYDSDPAYRQDVTRKLERSNIAF
jgi:hypothetical protein